MKSDIKKLNALIEKNKHRLNNLEFAQKIIPAGNFQSRIQKLETKLLKYHEALKHFSKPSEIHEMIYTIAGYHGHVFMENKRGYVVQAGNKTIRISEEGFIRHWFSSESFDGFNDYEFWIEKVKKEGKGTPVANHAAFHVSKRSQ
ncbi:hypothetical protein AO073_01655 [Pseudomonas syringae ICMP 11293]|uniref:hypothetical protein n=1 Tax=Pseudomonas syringae TaxID=317 RepID=UPI00072FAE2B|nr:hypothetical protein [Pseudomonas syringae]KTB91605.1 hypothetical protein AO073_01655 [Pseudomonas syringae ICMP 11293]